MSGLSVVELFAGTRPDGSPVVERLQVAEQEGDCFVLVKSPAFIKGLAKGDKIKLLRDEQSFELVKHSGHLCVRVFARGNIRKIAEQVTPRLEKLGGELDFENERMLVFSIHVSCGFKAIEKILGDYTGESSDSTWFYGNVYDPKDGATPLNWWQEILKPQ